MKGKEFRTIIVVSMLILMMSLPLVFKKFYLFERQGMLYEYTYTPEVSYQVKVNNSQLYTEQIRGEESYYLWQFVEQIMPKFSFKLQTSLPVRVTGNYTIVAEVRGVTTKEQHKEIIWQKEFSLLPEVTIDTDTEQLEQTHSVTIDEKRYKEWAQKIMQDSQVQSNLEACISMKGKLNIDYQGKVQGVPIDTSLIVPLDQNYFSMTKQGIEPVTEQIKDEDGTPNGQYQGIVIAELIICLLGTGGVFISQKIKGHREHAVQRDKMIRKIFRLYGSRLVEIDHIASYPSERIYSVKKLEDLIKLAQELGCPIFYLADEKGIREDTFYIFDKENLYFYQLS